MRRLLILAVDGLEANLVEGLRLEALLQRYHGRYYVEAEKHATPALWAAFLTGLPPETFSIKFVERNVPESIRRLRFLRFLKPLGRRIFKLHPPTIRRRYETIFDYFLKPLPFNVFSYNEEREQFMLRMKYSLPRTVGDKMKSLRAKREWKELTRSLLDRFSEMLEGEWDLAMTHIYYTDIIGHLFYDKIEELVESYLMVNEYVKRISKEVEPCVILIVSDHGMRRGIHTNHAFWSSNVQLSLTPKKITDFHGLIMDIQREGAP
jgi:hypothetical protein